MAQNSGKENSCFQFEQLFISYYGGPFWSKLNKIFSLLIELFVLAVYFILLYTYIVTFCRAFFFVTFHEFFAHSTTNFFLQCTDYFWHPF